MSNVNHNGPAPETEMHFVSSSVEIRQLVRRTSSLSFRPEHTDAFSSRSLRANASVCAVEEPLFDLSAKVGSLFALSTKEDC
jgi:hypothetical protein